jgi:hypothetical protein
MFTRRWKAIQVTLLIPALLLLASSLTTAYAQGASTPTEAAQTLIKPFYDPSAGNQPCNALSGKLQDCPVTARLLQRLQNPERNVGTGNLVSRSQNPPSSVSVSLMDNNGQTARVSTVWQYGAGGSYTIIFVVVKQANGWAVDDSYCSGGSANQAQSTSIYIPPVGPCPLANVQTATGTATATVPGVPRTGAGGYPDYAWPALLAVLALLAGLSLRVWSKARS